MLKIAIIGATGYTGLELLRILAKHPEVEIVSVTSRQEAGKKVREVFPFESYFAELVFEEPDVSKIAPRVDLVFLCVPHGAAAETARAFLEAGVKVIDLSADFRLKDAAVYESWYKTKHPCPELLSKAVYGLPEIYREEIKGASLVANPGCYPTASILPLVPLLKEKLIEPQSIIIDAKSGVSGAGRSAKLRLIFCEVNEDFCAYNVAVHRHTPEIEQELNQASGFSFHINFTTHLVPMSRGILATSYAEVKEGVTERDLREALKSAYAREPFIKILDEGLYPQTAHVKGTNLCLIGLKFDPRTGRAIIISAIDNLVKGASGQAVQNMNLMAGFPETLGLEKRPLFP
ncbi:N-acetyl-gamma-glutamyl-phosphate reductase [Thermodesulfatator indicus DSM 15286]|uniref:N-acetyl-gamma-glutamyl-phosphate reductase n=1 Tax=Thermodesulfatator indicus (strain DSM 15286 / JCM 11887 / CIR29812) TaxID=667014 RepID=F8A9L5_THEID|nr:N-acetyl-gamma-glutamyl-phosphate reductase [Thermodesulfatator indicus]AEH45241.1 N-acetyl-gamma-glutamyl-phosphate reductase [Thermodesulfatator indicus DSM 15286]